MHMAGIDWHGLGPTKQHARLHNNKHGRNQNGADRIYMSDRIERQAILLFCGGVAAKPSRPGMRGLVKGNRQQDR